MLVFCFTLLAFNSGGSRISSIEDGVHCDKSQRLDAITIVTRGSILYLARLLDQRLKSIDKLRKR